MAIHHRGTGHPMDTDIDLPIEDAETTGLENDNESTSGSDATITLRVRKVEDHPDNLIHANEAKLTGLMTYANKQRLEKDNQQRVWTI